MILGFLLNVLALITGIEASAVGPTAELLFVGDAMQHQAQLDVAHKLGNNKCYNYDDCFILMAPEVMKADYAVCNLELPLGGGNNYSGFPCFSAPDSYAIALRDAGFDLFLTANNHCLDRKDKGARRTLEALDNIGVDHIGTYHDAAQRDSLVPFVKDINGFKVGFLNYTYGTNGILPTEGAEVALIDKQKIKEEIKKTRDAGAEIITVAIHWGIEYVLTENNVQRELADFLKKEGVDLIIGGHPHVIQPMRFEFDAEQNKNIFTVYSLGNFISNMRTADTRGGALTRVTLARDDQGKAIVENVDYDLVYVQKPEQGNPNFRVMPARKAEELLKGEQYNQWKLFEKNATNIFDKHNVNVERKSN